MKNVKLIVQYADANDKDVIELLAISSVESDLNPKAISHKGAVGLFQVMCRTWSKALGYNSIKDCNKLLLKPENNIRAGSYVLTTIRKKYKQCSGDLAYRCYYAGPRWKRMRGKTAKQIVRYADKVKERKKILSDPYYTKLIQDVRFALRNNS
tara:strand:- start:86 stop:544 length:459 start_codon:yes stop_codon:yes gene_type:complete